MLPFFFHDNTHLETLDSLLFATICPSWISCANVGIVITLGHTLAIPLDNVDESAIFKDCCYGTKHFSGTTSYFLESYNWHNSCLRSLGMNLCNKIYKTLLDDLVFVCHTRWWLQCFSSKLTLMSLVQVNECTSKLLKRRLAHGKMCLLTTFFCLDLSQLEVRHYYDWNINQCITL
jgi:hypothetical protein